MLGANGAVLVLMMSLMLGMACAAEVENFQEGDLKIRYYGEHCRNADGTVGSLADKVRGAMSFPATMQVLSTNIEPVARVNEFKGEVSFNQYGWGPLSFDEFQATLDDGWGEYPRFHKVQMEISTKSKANIIVGITVHAFIEHQTCAETWVILPGAGKRGFDVIWTRDEGWYDEYQKWLDGE